MRIYVPDNITLCHHFEQGPGGGPALTAYRDTAGNWTIGFGHKMLPSDPLVHQAIDLITAARLLDADLYKAAMQLASCLGAKSATLSDGQWGALVDFVFNLGIGAFEGSTIHDIIVHGDLAAAPEQIERWDHGRVGGVEEVLAGLARRRAAEIQLWNTGAWRPAQ